MKKLYLYPAMFALALAGCSREPAPDEAPTKQTAAPAAPTPSVPEAPAPDAPAVETNLAALAQFRAIGTEPFWNATVDGNTITYSTPDNQEGVRFTATRNSDPDRLMMTGTMDDQAFEMTVRREKCSDGMSDRSYDYVARIEIGDGVLNGCAIAGTAQ